MKTWMLLMLLAPGVGQAWELIDPARPGEGAVTTTTIADILVVEETSSDAAGPLPSNMERYYWIAFAEADVAATCQRIGNLPQDSRVVYHDRYVQLEPLGVQQRKLPIALFAQAHGMRVRVKIKAAFGNPSRCYVTWLQTCTGPNSCVAP